MKNNRRYSFPLQGTRGQGGRLSARTKERAVPGERRGSQSDLGAVVLELAGEHPAIQLVELHQLD